eukprot:jgi/Bigna1/136302/aug1.33_g11010
MLRAKGPFIDSQELLSPDVAFRGAPLWEEQGGQNYLRSVEAWREALKGLPESSFAIDRISQTSPTTVICNWNVSFVPPSLLSFAALARSIPNVEVRYIDILHRIEFPVTGFTWQKLRYLLRCISKGFVPVAVAVIQGTTTFELESVGEEGTFNERWEDEKKKKSTVFNGPKSRAFERYALESEELAAARQNFQDRYDAVSNETDVPGMNPLDVDGIDAETQGEFLQSSGIVLTFAATVMLVLGIGFAALYFAQMQQEIALREIMFDEELLSSSLKLS